MVLVDTSVWVAHLRNGIAGLKTLLNDGQVACHPFITGELACGNLKNRAEILSLLGDLETVQPASHDEVLHFIERRKLMARGLGYIDMHLLASALLSNVQLWTLDKRLAEAASSLRVEYLP